MMSQRTTPNRNLRTILYAGRTVGLLLTLLSVLSFPIMTDVDAIVHATASPVARAKPAAQAAITCAEGTQASGALYQICMPDGWNGTVILWSHGYAQPFEPLAIHNTLEDTPLPETYAQFGYAFATTSFSKNGLAIRQGVDDLLDLVDIFKAQHGEPERIYLHGVSMGSLTATLAIEENPELFAGGLAMCGPLGDFQSQLDYFVHTRALVDFFFPDLLSPSPVRIPDALIANWGDIANNEVVPTLADPANSSQVSQLLNTSHVAFDSDVVTTTVDALATVLWFNVLGTNDAVATLGGQPFDNREQVYAGSLDDDLLNQYVARFASKAIAVNEISQRYQTSGQLPVPLVTMHTTLDPVVPYSQSEAFGAKVVAAGQSAKHIHHGFARYGHCAFTSDEVLAGLTTLNEMVNNLPPKGAQPPAPTIYLPIIATMNNP